MDALCWLVSSESSAAAPEFSFLSNLYYATSNDLYNRDGGYICEIVIAMITGFLLDICTCFLTGIFMGLVPVAMKQN